MEQEITTPNFDITIVFLIGSVLALFLALVTACSLIFEKKDDDKVNFIKDILWKAQPYICLAASFTLIYMSAGNSFGVSLFNGIGSFLHVSLEYEKSSLTEFANILATLATLTALISSIRGFLKLIVYMIYERLLKRELFILHTDGEIGSAIKENFINDNKTIVEVNKDNEHYYAKFKNHILAYDSEDYNAKTTASILKVKDDATIYVLTSNNDSMFYERQNIYAINKDELIAKSFWIGNKDEIFSIFKNKNYKKCNVAIVGSNNLTIEILKYALRNCLYDLKQNINYHIFTDKLEKYKYEFINDSIIDKMNEDTINIYDFRYENMNRIYDADITIVTDEKYMSKMALSFGKGKNIYIYSNNYSQADFEKFSNQENVNWYNAKVFGENKQTFTVENVIGVEHTKLAKLINYAYEKNYGAFVKEDANTLWNNASIYNKKSSMAVADYFEIRKLIKNKDTSVGFLEQLEHTRWCRYMYLMGYRYQKSTGDKDKDKELKKLKMHPCLRPLDSSNKADKETLEKDIRIYQYIEENDNE